MCGAACREQLAAAALTCADAETGASQFEIVLGHQEALTAADNLQLAVEALRLIAARHGLLLSLHPKPLPQGQCTGCHLHFSIEKVSSNKYSLACSASASSHLRRCADKTREADTPPGSRCGG